MHVAVVASEAVPFAKTGGLADVIGALPRALEDAGHTTCIFLPAYRCTRDSRTPISATGIQLQVPVGSRKVDGTILESTLPGSSVKVYLIDQPAYFDRSGLYGSHGKDYDDNCERFVFFDRAVLEALGPLGIRPDVIHCNDWQTGLIPVYMKTIYQNTPSIARAGSLLTIHNLAYLGLFWQRDMALTGLDWRLFNWRQLEFHGRICFMKAGLVFADMLCAVSPNYAKEIQTPRFGSGLDGLLRDRSAELRGIVNGIDPEIWSPASEPMITCQYDAATARSRQGCLQGLAPAQGGLPRAARRAAVRPDRPTRPPERLGLARCRRR